MNKSGVWIISIILIVALGAGGYFFYNQKLTQDSYNSAMSLYRAKQYLAAYTIFKDLGNYNGAAAMCDACKEYIYNEAIEFMNGQKYEEANKNFTAIIGYKDSQIKAEETKKLYTDINDTYVAANSLLNQKKYKEALEKFKLVSFYKDSVSFIKICESGSSDEIYNECLVFIKDKKFEEAIEKLKIIIDFKDSTELIKKCETGIKDRIYDEAIKLKSAEKYEEAIEKFQQIIDHKDSKQQIEECEGGTKYKRYLEAVGLAKNKKYKEAIAIFVELGDYKDSRGRKVYCDKMFLDTIDHALKDIKLEMVFCPAGSFNMGYSKEELTLLGNKPVPTSHKVTLTQPFKIGKYEITQAQYKTIMGNNPSENKGKDNHPVERVSLNNAMEFCRKLNKRYASSLPEGYQFDIPTEAQWEYACRAETTTLFNNGKNLEGADEVAWHKDNAKYKTQPVGTKKPNAWGIYDMHGNVWEWCKDYYSPYKLEEATDPLIMDGEENIIRGGNCGAPAKWGVSAARECDSSGAKSSNYGFRVVLTAIEK